jgi:hypothetical protein
MLITWYTYVRAMSGKLPSNVHKCGSFHYNVLSFGLSNAPAAFQSFMDDIFKVMCWE